MTAVRLAPMHQKRGRKGRGVVLDKMTARVRQSIGSNFEKNKRLKMLTERMTVVENVLLEGWDTMSPEQNRAYSVEAIELVKKIERVERAIAQEKALEAAKNKIVTDLPENNDTFSRT